MTTTPTPAAEPKPCPFCGGTALKGFSPIRPAACCGNHECRLHGIWFPLAAWNRRAPDPAADSPPRAKTFYVASKVRHAPMWRKLRTSLAPDIRIIATWIDEDGEGQTKDAGELAERCLRESVEADEFLLYVEQQDALKGALVELGARLNANKSAVCVGDGQNWPSGVFKNHAKVRYAYSLSEAFGAVLPVPAGARAESDTATGGGK